MRTIVDELVRAGMPEVRCLTGPQESAPSLTRNNSAANTVTEKARISISLVAAFVVDRVRVQNPPVEAQHRPDLATQLTRRRRGATLQLLGSLGGLGRERLDSLGRAYRQITHRGPGASLNCTGTRPTA